MKIFMKIAVILLATIMIVSLAGCRHATGGSDGGDGGSSGAEDGQTQGTVIAGITIDNTTYDKTSSVIIIPKGTTAIINMTDDSSWSTYQIGRAHV